MLGRRLLKIKRTSVFSKETERSLLEKNRATSFTEEKTKAQKVKLLPQITQPLGRGNLMWEGPESESTWRECSGSDGQGLGGLPEGLGLPFKFNGQQLKGVT